MFKWTQNSLTKCILKTRFYVEIKVKPTQNKLRILKDAKYNGCEYKIFDFTWGRVFWEITWQNTAFQTMKLYNFFYILQKHLDLNNVTKTQI
jgi:hypothetical protein